MHDLQDFSDLRSTVDEIANEYSLSRRMLIVALTTIVAEEFEQVN